MNDELKEKILSYMREHNTLTLSTCSNGGEPWAASVFYANDGFTIYFLSDLKTRHGRDALDNPLVAATIDEDYRDWRLIKGIQLEGRAELVSGVREKARAWRVYLGKFPFVADFFSTTNAPSLAIFARATSTQFFKISPRRLLYLDNERSFGHREEIVL